MMGIPGKVIKVPFKTNNAFNSTMMASFLLVIVSKKNKQTWKNMSFVGPMQCRANDFLFQKN